MLNVFLFFKYINLLKCNVWRKCYTKLVSAKFKLLITVARYRFAAGVPNYNEALMSCANHDYPKLLNVKGKTKLLSIAKHLKILTMIVTAVLFIYSLGLPLRYLQSNSWKTSLASTYFSNICFFKYLLSLV
jgi:hypothetical protein